MPESNLTPIDERESIPEPPPGYGPWREYSPPGGQWTSRATKAGAYLTTTLAGGLLFAFVLGTVPNIRTMTIPTFSTVTTGVIALTILVALVVVHEGFHGLAGWLIGADVSFQVRGGGFQTVSRHTVQTRRETLAFYLLPLVVATSVWFVLLVAAGYLRAPLVLVAAYFAVAANVAGSALDVYYAWGIFRLPHGTRIYTTKYRMLVASPSSPPN
jgi:uncharacterized membrane protein YphA (DoxX/SURF4 family)